MCASSGQPSLSSGRHPVFPQLVYMGFDTVAAEAALRVFKGNVQLAAQTLAHNGGSLPPDLQFPLEDSPSTPTTSLSDSAGRSGPLHTEEEEGGNVTSVDLPGD